MFTRQSPPSGPFYFLDGGGEMAGRIRSFDWANHPFGPIENWPQSLRASLSICLQSAFPTAIYWGPQLRLLYNDAWSLIPGPRHPAALGQPVEVVWSDIWHEIEPQFRAVIQTGDGLFQKDRMLPMARFGVPEETYWTYNMTPIRGESGAIVGVINSGHETTNEVLSNKQLQLLLKVREAMAAAGTFDQLFDIAASNLLAPFGVDAAVVYSHTDKPAEARALQSRSSTPAPIPSQSVQALLPALSEALALDHEFSFDCRTAEAAPPQISRAITAAGAAAVLVAARASSRGSFAIAVMSARPRIWNSYECTTIASIAQKLAEAVDRLSVRERERVIAREIDHRARNALAVAQSIVRQTLREGGPDLAQTIDTRLAALARTQALLANENWQVVDLASLIREELSPFSGCTIRIDGPNEAMPPPVAQAMALVVHELTTNSAKYGAIANAGALAISWTRVENYIHLDWSETFAKSTSPDQTAPPSGKLGAPLIDRLIRGHLRGSIEQTCDDEHFHAEVRFASAPVHVKPS